MLHVASTFVVLLLAVGLYLRHKYPLLHRRVMITAFVLDVLLVLYIEASRHAVEKVATHIQPLLWFHAAISLGVLACYVAMIVLGRRVIAGRIDYRQMHLYVGITFVVLRSLNYVTSFMLS